MSEVRVAIPVSAIGYGVNQETFQALLERQPHVIAADAGSTDSGPYYLGSGHSNKARRAVYRDFEIILTAARARGVPVVIGNAGTSGSKDHVAWALDVLLEVARDAGLSFRLGIVSADIEKSWISGRLRAGAVRPMPGVSELTQERIDASDRIVAQMGVEPYLRALDEGVDVILAGRSCDSAIIGSYAMWKGFDTGLSLHMGKVTECGAMCTWPATGRDGILGTVRRGSFAIETPNPARRVTPFSVAAHMIYESEHPYVQEEPQGTQDFSQMRVEQLTERSVEISGTRYVPRDRPTLKIEGSGSDGYRSFTMGGIRDPFLIEHVDRFVESVEADVARHLGGDAAACQMAWKIYGRDAVMGEMEPTPSLAGAHEIGMLFEVLAPTQEMAHDVCQYAEGRMIGFSYPGSRTRTANVAFPMSPLIHDSGPVYRFNIYHIAELEQEGDLTDLFPLEVLEVVNGEIRERTRPLNPSLEMQAG